ncbi:hypothetical protein [Phenylobacterium sp.]|jgi:hypothetical protein|uniref:hypothetical protein n=1 Tax=Phenylobacterium sp. TaxID=1871053 RepID=UPI002F94A49D
MAVSALLAGAARAQAPYDLVDLTVVDRESGAPMRVWRHKGRSFVAGRPGARYSLRLTNRSAGRVLVVMSVDGVNVLTGETAGYGQTGYVFDPYESYDISGWRKSDTQVAAFTFAGLSRSYAARTGRPGDVGVIGIAAFRERVVAPMARMAVPSEPVYESSAPASRGSPSTEEVVVSGSRVRGAAVAAPPPVVAQAAPQRRTEKLGTAHGAREWSAVTSVPFERATAYPQLIRQIEYDSYPNLVAAGVIPPRPAPAPRPRPFPNGGYVPDPPGGA